MFFKHKNNNSYIQLTDTPEGIILGEINGKHVCKANDTRGQNYIVYDSKLTNAKQTYVMPNIQSRIEKNESYIVYDPTGDIYDNTKLAAEQKGYTIQVLDLSDQSAGWNPLDFISRCDDFYKDIALTLYARSIFVNASSKEPFYDASELCLLKAIILYVLESDEPNTMGIVYDTLSKIVSDKKMTRKLNELSPAHPAYENWKLFESAGAFKTQVAQSVLLKLKPLTENNIGKILSKNDIDIPAHRDGKHATYIKTNNKLLTGMFFSMALEELLYETRDICTDQYIYFFFTEIEDMGTIIDLRDIIANNRKRGISISILTKSWDCMSESYERDAPFITSLCDWVLYNLSDDYIKAIIQELDTSKKILSGFTEGKIILKILNKVTMLD